MENVKGKEAMTAGFIGGDKVCRIVIASGCTKAIKEDAAALRDKIGAITGVFPEIADDGTAPDGTPEILVGATARKESAELTAALEKCGYGIRISGSRAVITGANDDLVAVALYAFSDRFIGNTEFTANGRMTLPDGFEYVGVDASVGTVEEKLLSDRYVKAFLSSDDYISIPKRGDFTDAQGATFDGRYFYEALKKYDHGVETDIIVKYDTVTGKEVLVSEELPLDHCNDMAYNARINQVVVINMKGDTVTFIDPETLTIAKTVHVPHFTIPSPYAVTYDCEKDVYAFMYCGISFFDSDLNFIRSVPDNDCDSTYVPQGMDSCGDMVLVPLSYGSRTKEKNTAIQVYHKEKGYVKTVFLDMTNEIETIINYNGKYWGNFNFPGARIYGLDFTVLFR